MTDLNFWKSNTVISQRACTKTTPTVGDGASRKRIPDIEESHNFDGRRYGSLDSAKATVQDHKVRNNLTEFPLQLYFTAISPESSHGSPVTIQITTIKCPIISRYSTNRSQWSPQSSRRSPATIQIMTIKYPIISEKSRYNTNRSHEVPNHLGGVPLQY